MIPFRVLIDLAARFTPQPPPRGDRGDHRSPADPDATPKPRAPLRTPPQPSKRVAPYTDPEDDEGALRRLERLTDGRGYSPLVAAQRLFAPELLEINDA